MSLVTTLPLMPLHIITTVNQTTTKKNLIEQVTQALQKPKWNVWIIYCCRTGAKDKKCHPLPPSSHSLVSSPPRTTGSEPGRQYNFPDTTSDNFPPARLMHLFFAFSQGVCVCVCNSRRISIYFLRVSFNLFQTHTRNAFSTGAQLSVRRKSCAPMENKAKGNNIELSWAKKKEHRQSNYNCILIIEPAQPALRGISTHIDSREGLHKWLTREDERGPWNSVRS